MVEKKKLKLKIEKIEPEENPSGMVVLRMTLKTEKGTYTEGVALEHWENPRDKASVIKHWVRKIEAIESRKKLSEEEVKEKVKKYEGEELTDE